MLPAETESVFDDIKTCPGIEDFLLVGGTALSMYLDHRYSEDLDFLSMASLDVEAINRIMACLETRGRWVVEAPPLELIQEFEDSGLNPDYAQRVFSVDGVKVEFFHYIPPKTDKFDRARIKAGAPSSIDTARLRVAALDSIFYLKALLIPTRSRYRDLFDLHVLVTEAGYSLDDLFEVAREQGYLHDHYVRFLLHRKLAADDPGVQLGAGKAAPGYEKLVERFAELVSQWEVREAEKAR